MADYIKKVSAQIASFFGELSPGKRIMTILAGLGIMGVMGGIFYWATYQTYQPLMTNLNTDDSANIIRILREKRIPFKVDDGGRAISVPPESIYDLRLELASSGLPDSSVVGYEIFDTQSIGTTSFVQQVNRVRAREGELMRTISTIKGVRRSRVHLAIPKKSAFVEDQRPPSASVVLDLEPGFRLSEKQIFGIGNLVSSAVEGLDVASVVIVDSHGKTLSKNTRDPIAAITASQLDYRRRYEDDIENRVKSILAPVIGEGRVSAMVTAEMDFSQVSETQTIFDADSAAPKSTQTNSETMSGKRPSPYGRPGAVTNQPGQANAGPESQSTTDTNKRREITNYAVPKTVIQTRKPAVQVKKLSIAVVVDGKNTQEQGEEGEVLAKVVPWSEEELQGFSDIVTSAVALDSKRGDTLQIKNMDFKREDFAEAERLMEQAQRRRYLTNLVVYLVIGAIIALFFFFVVRPFIKWLTENTIDSVDTFLPQTIEELEKLQKNQQLPGLEETVPELPEKIDPEKVEGEMIKEKIITMVDTNPHKAALILRDWVRGEKNKKSEDAEKPAGQAG